MWISKQISTLAIIFCAFAGKSQDKGHSPELEQMHNHAVENAVMGNFKDAIITYKQLMVLAPDWKGLQKELGFAYYHNGEYWQAEQTLTPVLTTLECDTQVYRILGACLTGQKKKKEAKAIITKGIKQFPASGSLYYESAMIQLEEMDREEAITDLLKGIELDQGFAPNYREVANIYLASEKPLWGLLYGEIYLGMTNDSTGTDELKTNLLNGWKKIFEHLRPDNKKGFENDINNIYFNLTPVVSDGVTTENLTMVRIRFLMEWDKENAKKYPFSLFTYQQLMIQNGWFDIYNEWLFGTAESKVQYDAWNRFHDGALTKFKEWRVDHLLIPAKTDNYNTGETKGLFTQKKKR